MSVNRNDACPCGSGKKYKKCCLNKKNVIQIKEVKEERFFQQKNAVVERMRGFIRTKIPRDIYFQLEKEFNKRTKQLISTNIRDGFFQFWLYFCHRYENGLRGIEWFYQDQQSKLTYEEKTMAKSWSGLTLKLVEAVNKKDSVVLFEDMLTKEQFTVPVIKENIPTFLPWYGTLGLLENHDGQDYFNGVRIFKGPAHLMNALEFVRNLFREKDQNHEQILFDYYPEILSILVGDGLGESPTVQQNQQIKQYIYEYKILSEVLLENFLKNHKNFIVDKVELNRKTYSWVGAWKKYQDSEMEGEIIIAEVFATLSIEHNQLIIQSFDKNRADELMAMLKKAILAIQFTSDKTKTIKMPSQAVMKNSFVQMSQNAPYYYSIYAQTNLFEEIELPLLKYDNRSIRQMVEANETEKALSWLKQMENNLYQQALQQTDKIEVTADLNTVRKILGLQPSPFVTGGASRQSGFIEIDNPYNQVIIEKEDIPFYEDLGFTPSTIDNFYSGDLIDFYKEKTIGKGDGTVRKYKNGVFILREELENSSVQGWKECKEEFWQELLVAMYQDKELSKTFLKDFISTIKAFVKWIDSKKQTTISSSLLSVLKRLESTVQTEKKLQKV